MELNMSIRKSKVRASVHRGRNVKPFSYRTVSGKTAWGETEITVIN
jgi:hypothetical protein